MRDLIKKIVWCPSCRETHLDAEVGDKCDKCGTELAIVPPFTVPMPEN